MVPAPSLDSSSLSRARTYLERRVAIDTRTLAVFRVFVGLLVIADLLLRARNFPFYYTNDGVVPRWLAMEQTADYAFSFYYLTTDPYLIAGLFVLQGLIAVQLIVGYKTRIASILTFLFVVSLDHHNPLVLSYADTLFRLLLFWAMFLPLGERWSIDAVHRGREPRASITSFASALILGQMVYMYVMNGYHKSKDELWTSGDATPLIMGLDNTTFLLGEFMRNFPTLLQLGGLTWYYMLLFAWLLILLPGRARMAFAGMFLVAHASFAVTVRIGAFPYVAIAGVLLFLQAQFWDDTARLARRLGIDLDRLRAQLTDLEDLAARVPDYRFDSDRQRQVKDGLYTFTIVVVVVTIAMVAGISALQLGGVVDDDIGHDQEVERVASSLSIDQPDWSVFAPTPRTTDRYYVFPAETADGEYVDVYNERPLTYDRPGDELQKQYDTYRERFFMGDIRRANDGDPEPELLAEHLCTTWEEEHGDELVRINMYLISEDVTMETIDDHEDRDRSIRLLSKHGCGDNEPERIDPPED
ncbi:HTTM domain-containing protein [Natrialbaceae archaeon AArc-T1-2]|uniref:HTTM domain-containing protein n=1 Tax=Natrialbaceae archaeon AArc-T1-2 TaxID=3053904 RepID=UPI00255B1A3B|nr:HTTM domain-containing protein [Natrialbaceae archaeon AArc-T1-2]WIV67457.1 HTTM domain-containing protein [Natrialbaceae archaeon AArc-T1-2]